MFALSSQTLGQCSMFAGVRARMLYCPKAVIVGDPKLGDNRALLLVFLQKC